MLFVIKNIRSTEICFLQKTDYRKVRFLSLAIIFMFISSAVSKSLAVRIIKKEFFLIRYLQSRNVANKWRTPAVQRIMKNHEGTKYRHIVAMRGEVSTFFIQSLLLRIFLFCKEAA